MKPHHYLSSIGSFAAILLSLMPGADSRAQDLQTQATRAATATAAPAPNLAACSPDGESYAVATQDGRIKCGSTQDGARRRTLYLCNPRVLVFSPDSRLLAAAGGSNGGPAKIKVWQVADGAMIRRLETDAGSDPLLSFSPDSRLLAVAGGANGCPPKMKVWQVTDGAMLCELKTDVGLDPLLSFSPDGQLLVSTGEGSRINLWQLPDGKLKWSETTDRPVSRLAFSKDGKAVVAVFADGGVQRFAVP